MSWRMKKLEIGNLSGNYCNSWVRANEDLLRAVAIRTEERNHVRGMGRNIARA